MNNNGIIEKINPNWYSISLISTLILGILMLFFKELPDNWKDNFIPAFVIYVLGTCIIGYIQGSLFRAKGMNNNFKEPLWLYYFLYGIWFILLVGYLYFKNIL